MEDKKANITAASTVIALIIFIIIARVSLKLSKTFFLILGADIAIIIAVFAWMNIRMRYNRRRKLLETQLVSEGRELRIEYSFLRKVAEIIGGRRNVCLIEHGNDKSKRKWQYFPKIVNEKLKEGKLMEIVDHRLTLDGGSIDERQLKRLVYVAFWCIQENARLRPSIARVVEMLEGRVTVDEPPDTQMVIVDLLSMDEDQQPEAGHERKRIAKLVSPVDRNVPATSMRSFSMSVLSGRQRPKRRAARVQVLCSSWSLLSPSPVHFKVKMSLSGPSMSSGGKTVRRALEFGRTYVVRPKGKHQATVVWLHGLGDNGSSWSQLLETLPLPNIKWICPTAPTQPMTMFGGFPSTAWFDVEDLSEDVADDLEGLDAAAAHVANLLSTEPADIKLGIGGFSMGAATSLYSATCFAAGKFGNGNPYPANLSAVVGLSGWLPCAKTLKNKLGVDNEVTRRTASVPILLCHGKVDDVVMYKFGEKSSQALNSNGFQNVTFKGYNGLGHYTIPEEMDEVCAWLTSKLGLEGSSS
ncbi:hypothetical protein LWI29_010293 [Acer saccharum]|uniref:Phospholipase/carboxylesterase/thioesterase domain-containing protein n=1 Tax=Acer saccharum TaxID=4024 RepID=A0AA39VAV7_ACESA|nr:hypothetical protein LWI29_010293 [Acer saccharum]